MKPYISNSQVQDWNRCRKLYFYKHIWGITVKPNKLSNPIKIGKLWDIVDQMRYGKVAKEDVRGIITEYEIDIYDVEKVRGLLKAYCELVDISPDCECQFEINKDISFSNLDETATIKGIIDRSYKDYFVETKFTGYPEFSMKAFEIESQIGTYFLLNPTYEYCSMEITVKPQIRAGTKNNPMSPEQYREKVYMDALSRPSFYFKGYNRNKKTFGIRFYPKDFDLAELEARYAYIWDEIRTYSAMLPDKNRIKYFYKQETGCRAYNTLCDYYSICNTGGISESIFIIPEGLKERVSGVLKKVEGE